MTVRWRHHPRVPDPTGPSRPRTRAGWLGVFVALAITLTTIPGLPPLADGHTHVWESAKIAEAWESGWETLTRYLNATLLLTPPTDPPAHGPTLAFLGDHARLLDTGHLIGGPEATPEATRVRLQAAIRAR